MPRKNIGGANLEFGLVETVVLCYTAVALFLSLYFVPFKIVPRAWAKAVQTAGHPAQVALDRVLDAAVVKIKFPVIPPYPTIPDYGAQIRQMHGQLNARLTKEVGAIAAQVSGIKASISEIKIPEIPPYPETPDLAKFEERLDKLTAGFNGATELLNNLTEDKLTEIMKRVYTDFDKARTARGGKDGNTDALVEIASIGGQAAEHPEAAMAFKGIMSVIDFAEGLIQDTPANAKKIAKARAQAQSAFENGEDLLALRDQFRQTFPTAYANFAGAPPGGATNARNIPTY